MPKSADPTAYDVTYTTRLGENTVRILAPDAEAAKEQVSASAPAPILSISARKVATEAPPADAAAH